MTSRGWKASFSGSHTGFIWERETPKMATSGQFTMGVDPVPPIPPQVGEAEGASLHLLRRELPLPGPFGNFLKLFGQAQNPLLVHIPDHRHQEAMGGVHRYPDVHVILVDDLPLSTSMEALNLGKAFRVKARALRRKAVRVSRKPLSSARLA